MSRFTEEVFTSAPASGKGLVTGEPRNSLRRTWKEVHEIARCMAGSLASAGVNPGDAVGVLIGDPASIAPVIQAVWMRGASVTMLHQPGPRTELGAWAEDTFAVLDMIGAKVVVVGDVFARTMPLFEAQGTSVVSAETLAEGGGARTGRLRRGRYRVSAADVGLDGDSEGRGDLASESPRECGGDGERVETRSADRCAGELAAAVSRHGHDRIPRSAHAGRRGGYLRDAGRVSQIAADLAITDLQIRRHDDRRTELRVCPSRPLPAFGARRRVRSVVAAVRAQRCRTHRPDDRCRSARGRSQIRA